MWTRTHLIAFSGSLLLDLAFTLPSHGPAAIDRTVPRIDRNRMTRPVSLLARVAPGRGDELGLHEVAPGWAAGELAEEQLDALSENHPGIDYQITGDVHIVTDRGIRAVGVPQVETAGLRGKGTIVGIIDTGLDVTHPAFRDAQGNTRVAWLLDYSRPPRGKHADLETRFAQLGCIPNPAGGRCTVEKLGAIYSGEDIDGLLKALPTPPEPLPTDEVGHGSHVTGIAAGSIVGGSPFRGVAPEASIIVVKGGADGLSFPELSVSRGIEFVYDRAASLGLPAVINLSVANDLVARDGTDAFAESVAAQASGAGRILVAAAGNLGDPRAGAHQAAYIVDGASVRVDVEVPELAGPPGQSPPAADVTVLVLPHRGADIRVGLDSYEGRWISPVERGSTRSAPLGACVANVIFDPKDFGGAVSVHFSGAIVTWSGAFPAGTYGIVLEGEGGADLWISGRGVFAHGVRERTIGSPAMHPGIIAVGATVNRTSWTTAGGETIRLVEGQPDDASGLGLSPAGASIAGPVGPFSAGGPGLDGELKPDILAPGVGVISAASEDYAPTSDGMFSGQTCPPREDGQPQTRDPKCAFVDARHAVSSGTSMSAPFVTGAAALLLEVDPALSESDVRVVLSAGAHRLPPGVVFAEQASVGELDVAGSLAVLRRLHAPQALAAPALGRSWVSVNSHYAQADGTRPIVALYHLRTADDAPADGFGEDRFSASLAFDNRRLPAETLRRLAPGLWEARFSVPPRMATGSVAVEGRFDDTAVVDPHVLPVAFDPWQARYPSSGAAGSCALTPWRSPREDGLPPLLAGLAALVLWRGRRGRSPPPSSTGRSNRGSPR